MRADRIKTAKFTTSRMLTAATLIFLTVDRKASSLLVPLALKMLAKMLHSCHIGHLVMSCLHLVNTVHVNIQVVFMNV